MIIITDHKNLGYFKQLQNPLCGLHNQISSSAHSGVVQGHVEFLLVSLEQWHNDERSVRPKSSDKSREVFLEGDLMMRSL